MAHRTVLVPSAFLMERRDAWDDGYEVIGPAEIAAGVPLEVAERIEVIVTGGDALDDRLVDSLPRLQLIACFTTGYAGIDVNRLHSRGVALTTAAGVNAHDVGDHAIALMLTWWHGMLHADRAVRAGTWQSGLVPRPSLRGKRAGIVGLGRIGLEIAGRCTALGLSVQWWGPHDKPGAPFERAANLIALARDADILFIATRAVLANSGQINAGVLEALGARGLLVNVSRGFLVDEPALIDALERGTIAGAALDVYAQEPASNRIWARFENCVLSPHIAGYTADAGIAMFGQLRENIRRHFAGEPLLTPVEDTR